LSGFRYRLVFDEQTNRLLKVIFNTKLGKKYYCLAGKTTEINHIMMRKIFGLDVIHEKSSWIVPMNSGKRSKIYKRKIAFRLEDSMVLNSRNTNEAEVNTGEAINLNLFFKHKHSGLIRTYSYIWIRATTSKRLRCIFM